MAMQTGVSSSKVLVLLGAGLTGSIILKSGKLSDVLAQLQELMQGVNEVDLSSTRIDPGLLAAQMIHAAGYSSYIMPAAAIGAMGYCYMWWKGLSFSDVMFVTKQNMANAVSNVSKQLDSLSEAVARTKKHLSQRLETLDWKIEEQKEMSGQILNEVNDVKSDISQIGFDIESIRDMIYGLEGKLEVLENKQDLTNSGVMYLCQVAGGIKEGINSRLFQDVGSKLEPLKITCEDNSLKGLQFLADSTVTNALEKPVITNKSNDLEPVTAKNVSAVKTRIHRSFPVGFSLAHDILRAGV
ncbi:hypothetical protein KSS87_020959 [Heliosperma pusillum]|nr:hypothetical protein KSS87_020959 [Heliosperma pusillum]